MDALEEFLSKLPEVQRLGLERMWAESEKAAEEEPDDE